MGQTAESVKSAPRPTDRLVGTRVDRYDILHKLAAGGMGSVYVARAVGMGGFERLVAIKVLHPHLAEEGDFITMFLDEARLAARIRHPNVVSTLDVAQWQDLRFLVMDYVEGDHLAGLLTRSYKGETRLPVRPVLRIVVEALAGLSAAHQLTDAQGNALNLVHRDVSPHNILVGTDGISRLTDFGVAKAEYRLSSTREGQFKGKLAYTAPETASTAYSEQRSDLFAMGVVLWEAITTKRLFHATNNVTLLRMLLEDPIPSPSTVDPDLAPFDPVLDKALSRDIDQRFQSAQEMLEAVESAAGAIGGLGSGRDVAALTRTMAAEKLERERVAIKTAIADLGDAPPLAYTTGRHRPAEPDALEAATLAEKSIAALAQRRRPSSLLWWLALGLLIAVGAAGALWAYGDADPETTTPVAEQPGEGEEPANDEGGAIDEGDSETAEVQTPEQAQGTGETGTAANANGEQTVETAGTTEEGAETDAERRLRERRERRERLRNMQGSMMDDDVYSNPYRQQ